MTAWLRETAAGLSIAILVTPRASRTEVAGTAEERLRIRVAAPPVAGEANQELVRFIAKSLGVPRSAVLVSARASGRRKTVLVQGIRAEAALRLLSV